MSIYAQQGYGKGTKIEIAFDENIIQGVILSPKNERPDKLEDYIDMLRNNHSNKTILFDPQFYVSNFSEPVSDGKLIEYPYYHAGISRVELSNPSKLSAYVNSVFKYEYSLSVNKLISPTITINDFNNKSSQLAISLAYESINNCNADTELLVSICVKENAFLNNNAMNEFLDIISLFEVDGFYLIIDRDNDNRIADMRKDVFCNIMFFCYNLATINEFNVIVGYTDLLGIPLSITGVNAVACGWYNNLKVFSESAFHPSTGGRRPNKRYTSTKLLNSILLFPELQAIYSQGNYSKVMSETQYDKLIKNSPIDDSIWTDEISCLHNWSSLSKLVDRIDEYQSVGEKAGFVIKQIINAQLIYSELKGIPFAQKSNSSHLKCWKETIYQFMKSIGETI